MENAKDPGPRNKPNRPQARPGGANRKPQPTKKPNGQRPAASQPAVNRPQTPANIVENPVSDIENLATDVEAPVELEPVEVAAAEEEPTAVDAEAPEVAADAVPAPDHAPVSRLNIARLTLPKLSMPKFSAGRSGNEDAAGVAPAVHDAPAIADTADATVDDVDDGADADEPVAEPAPVTVVAEPELDETAPAEVRPADVRPAEVPAAEAQPVQPAPAEAPAKAEPRPKTAAIPVVRPKTGSIAIVKPSEPATAVEAAVEPKKKAARSTADIVLEVVGLTRKFDDKIAVNAIDLEVHVGAFYGIVGPNGAGKTTTLSMITGLLRPNAGTVAIHGADVWSDPVVAKRNMGVLPDRLRLFDRLTGAQVLYYAGVLRGLDGPTVRKRTADLAGAFGLEDALGRLVTDYSAGMTKKVALAAAMIHSPRILVLDEPFESVDPVSAATITDILKNYAEAGGTVVLSSHSMDLVQRICDHVAVIVGGDLLADGTMAAVRNGQTLEERFVELAGGRKTVEGLEWLHSFSD